MNYLIEFSAQDRIPCLLRNFQGLHFRLNIEGDADVARNFFIFFQTWVEVTRSVSIPEKSDMSKLDRLTAIFFLPAKDISNAYIGNVTFRIQIKRCSQDEAQ
jgi:hypothetical protein